VRQAPSPPLSPAGWPVWIGLTFILLVGGALRVWGFDAGAPFRVGADEPVVVERVFHILETGNLNPHFFDYGSLTFYLHAGAARLTAAAGADPTWTGDLLATGRLTTALVGTLTILVVFAIGRRWGRSVALLAAAATAVLPAHVREAHFMLTDTPLTFFVGLTLLLAMRAAERRTLASLALAAVAVGAATAIKYPGVVAIILPLMAVLALPRERRLAGALVVPACAGAAYLLSAPYTVLALPEFLNGIAHLVQSYNQPREWQDGAAIYLTHLRNWFAWPGTLPLTIGWAALSTSFLGLALMPFWRPVSSSVIAASLPSVFAVVFFCVIAGQSLVFGRYLLPIGPMLAVGFAAGLTAVASILGPGRREATAAVVALLLLTPPAVTAVRWNLNHRLTTTTELAASWVMAHAVPQSDVVSEVPVQLPPSVRLTLMPRFSFDAWTRPASSTGSYVIVSGDGRAQLAGLTPASGGASALPSGVIPVATFAADARHPGAPITILHVPASR
jgi:4-amino-4-deoxy-L-arabinose transferase-like glycosyltransferase